MPKLDLPNAVRIKTESGEVTRLKGSAFNWSSPHYSGADHATLTGDFKRGHYVADDSKVDTLDQSFDYSGGLGTMVDSDGVLKWQPHNLFRHSEDLSNALWVEQFESGATFSGNQITVDTSEGYAYWRQASVIPSDALGGSFTVKCIVSCDQTITDVPFRSNDNTGVGEDELLQDLVAGVDTEITFNYVPTATSLDLGIDARNAIIPGGSNETGYTVTFKKVWCYRSDLGGMVSVPVAERGLASSSTYLPTKADPIPATPELVTNGEDWTGATASTPPTGWTSDGTTQFTISSEALRITRNSGDGRANQNITCTVGKIYVAQFEVLDTLSQDARIAISGVAALTVPNGSTGVYDLVFTATLATHELYLQAANNINADVTVDNVSVKELRYDPSSPRYLPRVGEHKYDSTTAKWNAHNLLTYSEFDAGVPTDWSVGFGSGTYTHTLGTELFGLPTITHEQTVSGRSYLAQVVTVSAPATYTFSVWVDTNASSIDSGSNIIGYITGFSDVALINILLSDADSNGLITKTFTTVSDTTGEIRFGIGTASNATGTLVFAAPHLYRSDLNGVVANSGNSVSGLYVPTTTTAVEPTLNTELSYKNKGLRLESEARTNLETYSSDIENAVYVDSELTVSNNQGEGLAGTNLASLTPTAASATHSLIRSYTTVASTTYTISALCSSNGYDFLLWRIDSFDGNGVKVSFDLSDGSMPTTLATAGSGFTAIKAGATDMGGGLYRVYCTFTTRSGASTTRLVQYVSNVNYDPFSVTAFSGDTTSGIYFGDVQLEAGDTPSTYIPTTGATATRPAETFETPAGTAPWSGISNTTVRREADYVSGYLPTSTAGAWLSDTDDTDVTAATPLDDDFTSYADTPALLAVWTDLSTGTGTATLSSGAIRLQGSDASNRGRAEIPITCVVGETYVVSLEVTVDGGGSVNYSVGTSSGSVGNLDVTESDVGTFNATFTASTTTHYFGFRTNSATDFSIDNVSVRLADVDRSTNDNGLAINGTITKTPVATGAELVAYSGFSASDYLEQPYNSDLDFGTGDFCVMGWVKTTHAGTTYVFLRRDPASSGEGPQMYFNSGSVVFGATTGGVVTSSTTANDGEWHFLTGVRRSGNLEVYIDGALDGTGTNSADIDNATATLRVGLTQAGGGAFGGSLALLRIAGSAPTAAEILEIYNREKVLFEGETTESRLGAELLTNGDLSTGDTTGWTATRGATLTNTSDNLTVDGTALAGAAGTQSFTTEVDKSYVVTWDLVSTTDSAETLFTVTTGSDIITGTVLVTDSAFAAGSYSEVFTAVGTTTYVHAGVSSAAETCVYDNISVKEYTPAAITDMQTPEVTIGIKGEMNYVDNGIAQELMFSRWYKDASNYINVSYATDGAYDRLKFEQVASGVTDNAQNISAPYSPGLNVPFNIASYHEVNKINGAADGTALTADTTPVSLPDLSATDLKWGFDFMGTIEHINVWDTSEEDTGIVYITE